MKKVLLLFLYFSVLIALLAFFAALFAVCAAFSAVTLGFLLSGAGIALYSPLHTVLNADYLGGILLLGIALIFLGLSLYLIKAAKPLLKLIEKAVDLSLTCARKILFGKGGLAV